MGDAVTPYGNRINLGTSTDFVQWENSHVSTRFPLDDDASVVSTDGRELPADFLVDLSVFTDSDPMSVKLSSAYIGPGLVSMSLSDDKGGLCVCSVPLSEYEPYTPFVMEGIPGRDAAGVCSFGVDPSLYENPVMLRFDPGVRISSSACHSVELGRLKRFVDPRNGQTATGDVELDLGPGLSAYLYYMDDAQLGDRLKRPCARIFMDTELDGSVTSYCDSKDEDENLHKVPISSINGLPPDCDGRIAIVFK